MKPQEFEKRLGIKLQEEPNLERMMRFDSRNSCTLDENGDVIGLNVCGNQLTDEKTSFLWKLPELRAVNLSENQLSAVSIPAKMGNLVYLDLSENEKLGKVDFSSGLPNLVKLDLCECGLGELELPSGFRKLESLDLRKNALSKFSFQGDCPCLAWLDLSKNKLVEFKLPLGFAQLKELYLDENPNLSTPPKETVEQGMEATLRYLRELARQGERELYEVKMLIVGEGETGKTTLWNKLQNPKHPVPDPDQLSTVGISIKEGWSFQHLDHPETAFFVNLWDFGGQEIQYMTHQFFLTRRSFYVLMADGRREVANFSYWLKVISLLGCDPDMPGKLPVLAVLNEKGNPIAQVPYDPETVNEDYPKLDLKKREVDFAKPDGRIEALRYAIQDILSHELPHLPLRFPAFWDDVRQELYRLRKTLNHIDFERFKAICLDKDITEEVSMLDLSQLLHDLGVILHFQEDINLANFIVLNPQWALNAVYDILRSDMVEKQQGRFDKKMLQDIWTERKYSRAEQNHLLNLMLKDNFEVCFRAEENGGEIYIAPQLLPQNRPVSLAWTSDASVLRYTYLYPFMPKGIIGRLIVRLHEFIFTKDGKKVVWEKGTMLEKEGCQALVLESKDANDGRQVIKIEVKGATRENRKNLLRDIREQVDRIHQRSFPSLRVEQKIPCCCLECIGLKDPNFYDYSDLRKRQEKGQKTVECRISYKNVPVKELLEGVFPANEMAPDRPQRKPDIDAEQPGSPKRVFFSYSKHDRQYLDELQRQLAVLRRQGKLQPWDDHHILPGEEWDEAVKQELETADIIMLLISANALSTDYIWKVEIERALERHERKEARVIPVILSPCLWEDTPFAKLNCLPAKGKVVSTYKDRDEAWLEVVKGIDKVLNL